CLRRLGATTAEVW
nr:immunoglobulin heavy chain junction region [Macaca mulatta]